MGSVYARHRIFTKSKNNRLLLPSENSSEYANMVCNFFRPCWTVIFKNHNSVLTRQVVQMRLNEHLIKDESTYLGLILRLTCFLRTSNIGLMIPGSIGTLFRVALKVLIDSNINILGRSLYDFEPYFQMAMASAFTSNVKLLLFDLRF